MHTGIYKIPVCIRGCENVPVCIRGRSFLKGILRTTYARHRVSLCNGVSRDLVQLEEAYNGWKGMATYSERQMVGFFSIVGGQGFLKCDCKGSCLSQKCKCKKANRVCNSRCHKSNTLCENCDH